MQTGLGGTGPADIIERILGTGIAVAGDIPVSLTGVEPLAGAAVP